MKGKELSRVVRYYVGRLLVRWTRACPRSVPWALAAAGSWRCITRIGGLLENLRQAFQADRPRSRMARRVFLELGRNIFDVAAWPRWSAAFRRRELELQGAEHLRTALASGRGVLLLAAHQGAWELVPVALAAEGFRVEAVARPIREPRLQLWLDEHRRALGVRTIPRGAVAGPRAARQRDAG